jgi:hypothetical protein
MSKSSCAAITPISVRLYIPFAPSRFRSTSPDPSREFNESFMHRRPADPPPATGSRLSSDIHPKSFAVTPKIKATGLKLLEVFTPIFISLLVAVVLLPFKLLGFVPKQTFYILFSQVWELFVHFFFGHSVFLEPIKKIMDIDAKVASIAH